MLFAMNLQHYQQDDLSAVVLRHSIGFGTDGNFCIYSNSNLKSYKIGLQMLMLIPYVKTGL